MAQDADRTFDAANAPIRDPSNWMRLLAFADTLSQGSVRSKIRIRSVAVLAVLVALSVGVVVFSRRGAVRSARVFSPVAMGSVLDLRVHAGKQSFLGVVLMPGGMKELVDQDGARTFNLDGRDTWTAVDFDPLVRQRGLTLFKDGQRGLDALLADTRGLQATPRTIAFAVRPKLVPGSLTVSPELASVLLGPTLSLANGAGQKVILDDSTYFINVAFAAGTQDHDARTGRTFAATAGRALFDAPYPYFLDMLDRSLRSGAVERNSLYRALFQLLTASDPSALASLAPTAKTALTDFIAIYAAELLRSRMSGAHKNAWMNDLAELIFVAPFVVLSGHLVAGGVFKEGTLREFFAEGPAGSGLGPRRNERRILQTALCACLWRADSEPMRQLADLVDVRDGSDVWSAMAAYIASPEKASLVVTKHEAITAAALALMARVERDVEPLTTCIRNR